MSSYLDFALEQLAPLGTITSRSMFGGYCLYCDGVVFAIIARDTLYLKADDGNRPEFEQRDLPPFRPFEDKPAVMQYYLAPAESFEDPEALLHWAGSAVEAGQRAQARKKRKPARRRPKDHLR